MPAKRILHVATYLHPDKFGGAERVVAGLGRAQAVAGHAVTVLTGNHGDLPEREECDGVAIVRYPVERGARGTAFFRSVARGVAGALAALPGEAPGFVHVHQLASA